MNKKLILKIAIDIVMTLLFLLLLFPFTTGLAFHEIAGLAILGIFAIHFTLNFKWVVGITRKFFHPDTPAFTRGKYILNLAILLNALLVIGTGVLISVELFPNIPRGDTALLAAVHKISSYTCGGMLLVHLALHKNYLVGAFKKIFASKNGQHVLLPSLSVFATLIVTGFIVWKAFPSGSSSDTDRLLDESGSSVNTLSKDNSDTDAENTQITTPSAEAEDVVSLDEYLSEQICTACPKRCPLSAPQCGRGEAQAETAIQKFAALYEVSLSEEPQTAAQTTPAGTAVLTLPETTTPAATTQITTPTVTEAPQTSAAVTAPAETEPEISLEEYLSKIVCTACPKRCLLSNPRCGRGERQAQEAAQDYTAAYGTSA